jgi:hypothetical protein
VVRYYSSLSPVEIEIYRSRYDESQHWRGKWEHQDWSQAVNLRKSLDPLLLDKLRCRHRLYNDRTVWVVDVKFGTIRDAQPIPYMLSVRDARTDAVVLTTPIDYNYIQLSDLQDIIYRHTHDNAPPSSSNRTKNLLIGGMSTFQITYYMRKWYKSNTTNGMSLTRIGQYLINIAGFPPDTHCILSWWTLVDIHVSCRAFQGSTNVIDETDSNDLCPPELRYCLQPVDFARLIKACSDMESVALGYTYRSVTNDDINWHDPAEDTLGMAAILRWFIAETTAWIE